MRGKCVQKIVDDIAASLLACMVAPFMNICTYRLLRTPHALPDTLENTCMCSLCNKIVQSPVLGGAV